MEPKTKSPSADGNRGVVRPVVDVVRPQPVDSLQPQSPQVFGRQPEELGVFLPGESLDEMTDARTVMGVATSLPPETYDSKFSVFHFNRRAFSITVAGLIVLSLLGVLSVVLAGGRHQGNANGTSKASNFAVKNIPVSDSTITAQLRVGSADKLSINGELHANNGFVLAPSAAPASPTVGQVYLSAADNQLYYYNGNGFKSLATTDSLTGLSRSTAGSGLVLNGNQLTNSGVLSVQGQSGAINFTAGQGISVNGTTIINSGVVAVTGTANQITVSQASGQVVLGLPQNISAAATPTFGGLNLGSALDVVSGGTGSSSLVADQLLLGNGTSPVSSVAAGNLGECLISNGSGVAPSFQSCGGSGGGATVGTATVGRLAKFTSSNTLSDSLLSEAGSVVTVNGDLSVTGVASGNGSGLTALSAANLTTGTVNDLRLSTNVTLAGNSYNGASQLVQLNGSGQLPAISGANLTNLNANNISSGTLAVTNGGTGAGTAAGARTSLGVAASGTNSDITALNGLASITGTGALNISAGGVNQNLTLQASGSGAVIINAPTFHNANGATYVFNATDLNAVNATICTTQGNCTGASGGGVVSTGTSNAIAVFGSDGYHLGNSLLSQDFPATTVTVGGALVTAGTVNGATISGGSLTGGTVSGGSLSSTAVNGLTVSGTAITGSADLTVSAGGSNQNLTLKGSGTGVVAVTGNFTASGTVNGATISGGNISGGSFNGATISGGSLSATAVNGLNVSSTAVSASGALNIAAGGVNQNLTLQGSGTGVVNVSGNFTASGTVNGATISGGNISGGSFNGATISGGSLTASAVNGLNVSGTAITGTAALTVSAGGTNQNLTLQGSGSGSVLVKVPTFSNANGATYSFDPADTVGTSATICTSLGNCTGGASVSSTGTSNSLALYGSDGNHLVNSILSQDVGATTVTAAGNLAASGTINGAIISGGTVSGGTLTSSAVNNLSVSGTAITGTGALSITAGGSNQSLSLSGSGTGNVIVGSSLLQGTGALGIAAGGSNQNLTLSASGTGSVIVNTPTFHNANGATYVFDPADLVGASGTVCTSLGNCTGASGGGVVSSGTTNAIAVFGSDGYHLANSILSQDVGATTLTIAGSTIAGSSALTLAAGGTNQNLTLQGSGTGSVLVKVPTFSNANGATYSFDPADLVGASGTVCTSLGNCTGSSGGGIVSTGTSNSIALFTTDGYHLGNSLLSQDFPATTLTVAGNLVASGSINTATISGGSLSGGTLTSSAVNGLNVSATAIGASGALSIAAGGTNQNLTLQGSGTGVVAVTGNFTASGTINGATISGGNISGGSFNGATISGGSLTASAVNSLNVSGTAISGTGALSIAAGGTNQNLTLQGSGTGAVIINTPTFHNANGATYAFNAADIGTVNATICTSQANCIGAGGGGVVSTGGSNSIPVFTTDGYHLGNSIVSQDVGATTATVAGDFVATGTVNGATISGGNISGGSFNGASITGGSLSASAVNGLNVSGTAITGSGALAISAGGSNQNLTLQGSGSGLVAVTGDLTVSGSINTATISGGTLSGGTLSGGTVSGGTLTASAVNGLNVSGSAISGTGALSLSAGGTNQNLTLQGTGTGSVVINVPTFHNANGATYTFNAADIASVNANICTSQGNCVGAGGGGVSSSGTTNSIAVFGVDGYHLANSILSQDVGATTLTVGGSTIVGSGVLAVKAATAVGTNVAGSTLTIASGAGTGTGNGGDINFQYAKAGVSGSTANTLQTACMISGVDGSISCTGASGAGSERFGAGSAAAGSFGTALGSSTSATGSATLAVGAFASANYDFSTVIGYGGIANGISSTVLGAGAYANTSAVSIGKSAQAGFTSSIALGTNATTSAANQFVVGGSGTAIQNVFIGNGVTNAAPVSFTLQASGASGTDVAGGSVTLAGGIGTGLGNGGNINFQIAKAAGSTGSTANTLATVASLSGTNGAALFQNSANSTTGFQIQNAAGATLFQVDTANSNITLAGNNSGELQNWNTSVSLGIGGANVGSAISNGYIYVVANGGSTTVKYAKLNADGTIGTVASATSFASTRSSAAVVTANGYLYAIGGTVAGSVSTEVDYARINPDGSLGNWIVAANGLPAAQTSGGAAYANGYLYYLGGSNGVGALSSNIYYSKLSADGSPSTWTTNASNLGTAVTNIYGSVAAANGVIYVVGGNTGGASWTSVVQRVTTNASTGAASTNTTTSWPQVAGDTSVGTADGYLYAAGGYNGSSALTNVYYAKINNGGTIGAWTSNGTSLPSSELDGSTINFYNGYAYFQNNSATTNFASTSRIKLSGSLDLVGAAGLSLAGGGASGGEITAGNINSVGNLQVQGYSSLQSVSVGGVLSVGSSATVQTSTNTTAAFRVQNATGGTLFSVDTSNAGLSLGNAGLAGSIQIGNTTGAVTQTINIGNNATASSVSTINIGSSIGTSPLLFQSGTSGVTIKGAASSTAFQVQNAAGAALINSDTVAMTLTVAPTGGYATFATKADSTTGTGPQNFATGDFNGDGKMDTIVLNAGGGTGTTASVFINTGTGLPATATSTLTGLGAPFAVATGDFNGDGKTDVLITNAGFGSGTTASVFINSGSALPTTATSTLTTGSGAWGVATGDFNGDGKTDAIVTNLTGNTASVFINSGSALPTTATSTLTGLNAPYAVATGDFNGDGKTDAIITNNGTTTASVFVNSGAALPTTATSTLTGLSAPEGVATGDFNGDGKTDAIVANSTGSTASVFVNSGVALPTTATSTLTTGTGAWGVATGDFNGDGKTDAVVTNSTGSTASVFVNSGAALPTTATSTLTPGTSPKGAATGDFNGDGKTDIAVANTTSSTLSVFLNTTTNALVVNGGSALNGALSLTSAGSGSALAIQNAGTGVDILIGSTNTGQIQSAGGTTTKGINIQSGIATAGASGTVSLQSGSGTTSTGAVSILSGNASAGASGGITVDTGTFTSGTPTISIGTANASAVSIGRTGQATTVNGTLTVTQAVTFSSTLSVKDVTINGHIKTGNSSGSTTAAVNANAGTSGSCTVSGNDTGGKITLVTGSGSWAAGVQCTITFANSYATTAPNPVITPANSTDTTLVKPYVDVPGSTPFTTWTLNFIAPDTAGNTYKFNYFNAQ